MLELNHIVLCGALPEHRRDYQQHIVSTSDRLYQQQGFSITQLREWAEKHRDDSPWKQAAGAYILMVSWPQPFAEGNHRTGALLMSSILVRLGKPPFVLSVDNAKGYFDPSSLAKSTQKSFFGLLYKLPKIKKKFARFLEENTRKKIFAAAVNRQLADVEHRIANGGFGHWPSVCVVAFYSVEGFTKMKSSCMSRRKSLGWGPFAACPEQHL